MFFLTHSLLQRRLCCDEIMHDLLRDPRELAVLANRADELHRLARRAQIFRFQSEGLLQHDVLDSLLVALGRLALRLGGDCRLAEDLQADLHRLLAELALHRLLAELGLLADTLLAELALGQLADPLLAEHALAQLADRVARDLSCADLRPGLLERVGVVHLHV